LVLADKGYLSAQGQLDLFCQSGIELQTPMRTNQTGYRPWPTVFKNARRRVETVFSQLSDQMMLKRNYAKSFRGYGYASSQKSLQSLSFSISTTKTIAP
jgi:hypothetical protein